MADKTPLEQLSEWVADESDLSLDDQGGILVGDDMRIAVDLDDERLLLTHTAVEQGAGDDRVAELSSRLPGRATTMTGSVDPGDGAATVTISNRVFLDGLNHQTFATALRELVGAIDALGLATGAAAAPAAAPEPEPEPEPEPAAAPEPQAEAPPPATPQTPEPTQEMAPAWTATHTVPSGGLGAWSEPNPELQPIANLDARVQLAVSERRGDWAKVIGSNGWTGWVDARRLVAVGGSTAGAPSSGFSFGSGKPNPIMLVGALLIGVAALLPWLDNGFQTFNAMDLSASILFDYEGTGSPYIGWVLFALGALALGAGFMAKPTAPAIVVGIAAVAVPVLFAAQIYRLVSDLGGSFSDLTEVIGFGPAAALVGGVVTIIGGNR
jgi:hypothetical protein